MKYIKQQALHERKSKDRQLIINNDGTIELNPLGELVTINGDLLVNGNTAGPRNNLIYYVSLEGDDNNSGLSSDSNGAKRTIKSAVEAAPAGATIQIAPGDYYENNPITLKERQTVRGTSLRNTQLYPLNNQDDIFYVDTACYIYQITFRGLRDPGWCVRIKPGANVLTSPYVQNCSNINGPWLNDGTEFIPFETEQIPGVEAGARPIIDDENVPIPKRVNENGGGNGMLVDGDDYGPRSLVKSMVADAFTQIAQGGIGFHITNFGYTQIVSCFTVFCRTGFLTTNGGYLSISNSVSDFGTFGIIANGLYETPYTTARPVQTYYSTVGSITVNTQGTGYTSIPSVTIEPPTTPGGVQATATANIDAVTQRVTAISVNNPGAGYDFLPDVTISGGGASVAATATANLSTNLTIQVGSLRDNPQVGSVVTFAGDATKYYVTNIDVITAPFIYDESVCRRDTRRIVDAISGDMAFGTNYQTLAAARSYLRVTAQKVIRQQLEPTIFALEAARDEMLARIPLTDPTNIAPRATVTNLFNLLINILEDGDSAAAPDVSYADLPTISSGTIRAKNNIVTNRDFIIEEILAYISEQFTNLSYNQDKCERDVRLITIGTAYDVALGTNFNSIVSGRSYTRANASVVIGPTQKAITLDSYEYLKSLIGNLAAVSSSATALTRSNAAINEIINWIDTGDTGTSFVFPTPTGGLPAKTNAKNHLVANREFIASEIGAWVAETFPNLDIDTEACERDVGYIIDGLCYDILYGGNIGSRISAQAYFVGTSAVISNNIEVLATKAAYERLQSVVSSVVVGQAFTKTASNPETQDFSSSNATSTEADDLVDLIQIIIDVIEDENLDNLPDEQYPSLSWPASALVSAATSIFGSRNTFATAITNYILATYPNFTYDRNKCRRDVEYIIELITRDIKLGTNHNAIVAGQAYRRSSANVVDQDQFPATILSIRYLQSLAEEQFSSNTTALTRCTTSFENLLEVLEYNTIPSEGVLFPAPPIASTELADSARQLQDNRTFLIEEVIAYLNDTYFTYNETDYREYFRRTLEAIGNDVALNTNYNAISTGIYLEYKLAVPEKVEFIAALTHLRSEVGTLISSSATSVSRSNAAFDEIIDIIQNGPLSANALTWTDPGIDANKRYAREQLQINRTFIVNETISWINTNYPGLSYNQTKCERDLGYIIDGLSYDIQYSTNLGTKLSTISYFDGAVSVLPAAQQAVTAQAFRQFVDIADDVLIENRPGQDTSGSVATSTEMDELAGLMQMLIAAVENDNLNSLPADDDPNLSWVAGEFVTSRALIVNNGDSSGNDFISEIIEYINSSLNGFSYDEESFKDETGYVIDAVTHDLLYGGNRSILLTTASYFNNNVSTIPGQEAETADAFEHLRDICVDIIEGVAIVPTAGNPETQSLVAGFGTITESTISSNLIDILITALTDSSGLLTTPENNDPDFSWVNANVAALANAFKADTAVYQQNVIDYITNEIVGFSYNEEKCARDTGYIIDAAVYDMMYGGNKQTRRAGEAYYNGAILANAVIGSSDQADVTEFTYKRLADVIRAVSLNESVSISEGNPLTQTITALNGSSTAANNIFINVEKISQVIREGNSALPVEIDHFYSGFTVNNLNSKRLAIMNELDAIEDESIRLLNEEYGGVADITIFPGITSIEIDTLGEMQNVSTVSTSGHAFEYVGAGITYNALPFFGGTPISANEFVESNNGKVFAGGVVDQIGNFKVGNFFTVNALTGAIALNANEISLSGLQSIGPFQRNGIPVGVELKEVSDNTNLIASTGSSAGDTVPTQNAVVQYVANRYLNKLTGGTVNGNVIFDLDIAVNGGDITSTSYAFNLLNTNVGVINFANAASSINIGNASGTTTVNHDLTVLGNILLGGGDDSSSGFLTTNSLTLNVFDTTATTVNAFGAATSIDIGAATGTFTINNDLIVINSSASIQIPVGDTSERPSPVTGQIRFNSQLQTFEGYGLTSWGSLGGVKDVDGDTYILAELSPASDEDTLYFYTGGTEVATINSSVFTIGTDVLIEQNTVILGILDAAGFRGSIFADDSTEIIDSINNKITVQSAVIGSLILSNDLEVQHGGTGVSSFTTDGIVYGNAASPLQVTDAAGASDINTSYQILTVTSDIDTTPVWTDTIDGGEY